MINILNSNQSKRLYATELKVIDEYTVRVIATNLETLENVTEIFVVRDRVIFPELLDELPRVLKDYEYNNDYLVRGVTLRTVIEDVINYIKADYTPVIY